MTAGDKSAKCSASRSTTAGAAQYLLTATSAFGLHRTPDNARLDGGHVGSWRGARRGLALDRANGDQPSLVHQDPLDGRGRIPAPALGNIAFDHRTSNFSSPISRPA